MSEEGITIKVEEDTISSGLTDLKKRGTNMQTVMSTIGEVILSNIEENFRAEGRYSEVGDWRGGTTNWKDLSDVTVKKRGQAHPILQQSGALASSFTKEASATGVQVGTNKVYAAIQNFGGMAGRNRKVKIPARPMMTIADESVKEMQDTIGDYLLKGNV
jgi:phage virion morphogenesis protein